MSTLRVIYVNNMWDYRDRDNGLEESEKGFLGTLAAINGFEVLWVPTDELSYECNYEDMQSAIFKLAEEFDLLINFAGRNEISALTLQSIHKYTKCKTIGIGSDDNWRYEDFTRIMAPFYDYWVTMSHTAMMKAADDGFENFIQSQWAITPKSFSRPEKERTKSVSFVGQPYGTRGEILTAISEFSPTVVGKGWSHSGRVTFDEMVDIYTDSKMGLNLSETYKGTERQLKLRPFEIAASGAMILTNHADDLSAYFEVGKECVVFDDIPDLVEKTRYYLEHDDEREKIAEAGKKRVLEDHTWADRLWHIFAKAGIELSHSDEPGRYEIATVTQRG